MKSKIKEPINFKEMMKRIEDISEELESDDLDLEIAITLYEEGIVLSEKCLEALKSAELKINSIKDKLNEN